MKTKHRDVYIHQKTGELVHASKAGAKKLGDDYKKIEFGTNENGKPTARVRIEGATIDISERDSVEVPDNGDTNTN